MKNFIFAMCALCAIHFSAMSQMTDHPQLVVRADDMGSSHASNLATMKTCLDGYVTSVEVMAIGPWFPEAVTLLKQHPEIDVGLHLVITSEWDNIKWRPLTSCPSLVDANGYFFPRMGADSNYPGQCICENKWNIAEIEQEFRAQIELVLRNLPQVTHLSGHMGSITFDKNVAAMTQRLADEYHLIIVDTPKPGVTGIGYHSMPHATSAEKESSFLKLIEELQPGKSYVFLDHPSFDNAEMQAVHHIGYTNVATDRQGVTDLFTSEKVKSYVKDNNIRLVNFNQLAKSLPRSTSEAENVTAGAVDRYLAAAKEKNLDVHSIMVLRHGKVVGEKWTGENGPDIPHVMFSVSKTFVSTAIGFAVQEGLLSVSDKVISFFPEDLPAEISPYLKDLEIRDLLTMTVGHAKDPTRDIREATGNNWIKDFLATPIEFEPGTRFVYNSMATYTLSAIIQKTTKQSVIDYLYPRLFRPLGIAGIHWESSPQGINCGGWGLYLKTEDMAKFGQFLLQSGNWQGQQLLSKAWFAEATTPKINIPPDGLSEEELNQRSDWAMGYCYQMWRCRHHAFRADGALGQYIIVIPEADAVVAITAKLDDMQTELALVWEHILPALK